MSQKNFMSYGDAEVVFTEVANAIKSLDPEGGTLDTRLTEVEKVIPTNATSSNLLVAKSDLTTRNIDVTYSATQNLDFNDFKGETNTKTSYWLRYGDTWANCPASTFSNIDWIILDVENAAGRVQQTVLIQTATNRTERWTRAFVYATPASGTTWSDWIRIATSTDLSAITDVIPSGASASNKLVTVNSCLNELEWGSYSGATLGDSVVNAMNTLTDLNTGGVTSYVRGYAFRGTWTGVGYWRATLSQPRTPTGQKWQALVQYEQANGTADNSADGVYVLSIECDTTQEVGSRFSLLSQTKLVAQSDLTSTVTSGSNAPITSGGVASAFNYQSGTDNHIQESAVVRDYQTHYTVTFDTPMPDTDYNIILNPIRVETVVSVNVKTVTGFTYYIRVISDSLSGDFGVKWNAFRIPR